MHLNLLVVCISSGKSDPYVSVKLGLQQHMKTEVKNRTLNPRYDETFDLLVYERSVEVREGGTGEDERLDSACWSCCSCFDWLDLFRLGRFLSVTLQR